MTDPIAGGNIAYAYHLYPNLGPATAVNLDRSSAHRLSDAARRTDVVRVRSVVGQPGDGGYDVGLGPARLRHANTRPLVSFAGPQVSAYARSDGNSYRSPMASSSATADQLRLTITDPSRINADIARFYEIAAH